MMRGVEAPHHALRRFKQDVVMSKIYLFLILVILSNPVHAICAEEGALGAHYLITSKKSDGDLISEKNMALWRNGKQVAHQYPDSHMTEVWEQSQNGMLKLVRHFDAYKRAIEYQPLEINNGKGDRDWSLKSHLISDRLKTKMQLFEQASGQACNKIEKYTLKEAGLEIELHWLPRLQLVKHMKVSRPGSIVEWRLKSLEFDRVKVGAVFNSRANEQMTDYIDIGDNESDPFLLKMMHLGSPQHGAALVYETRGLTAGAHARHHH